MQRHIRSGDAIGIDIIADFDALWIGDMDTFGNQLLDL
jgi:hypothetical protein